MHVRSLEAGEFPDVCVSGPDAQTLFVAYSHQQRLIFHTLRAADLADAAPVQIIEAVSAQAFPRLWAPWMTFRDGQERPVLWDLRTGTAYPRPTIANGNHPGCVNQDFFAYQDRDQAVWRLRLVDGPTGPETLIRQGAADGLSRILPSGEVRLTLEDRFLVPGMLRPAWSGPAWDGLPVAGEHPESGILFRWDGDQMLLAGEPTNTPRLVVAGDVAFLVTWGPGFPIRVLRVDRDSVPPPPPPPGPTGSAVPAFDRKLWTSPFFSYSHRAGIGETPDPFGNAITLVGDPRDPEMIRREILDYQRLAQPLIVAAGPEATANLNLTIAWWVSAPDLEGLGEAVRAALALPEKPVVAYLDARGWPADRPGWVTDRVWPSVQAYRRPSEDLRTFRIDVERDLARVGIYTRPCWLTCRFDDFNGTGTVAQTLEAVPAYEAWTRLYPVIGLHLFADRRPGGMQHHPVLRAAAKALVNGNPARPNRFDYWRPDGSDLRAVWQNKLQQSTMLLAADAAEKAWLLDQIGGT